MHKYIICMRYLYVCLFLSSRALFKLNTLLHILDDGRIYGFEEYF
jgi:hypothetical protein